MHIYLTGFGKFGNILNNQTMVIVNHLKKLVEEGKFNVPGLDVQDLTVVDVDIQSCDAHVDKVKEMILKADPNQKYFILNFGVAAGDPKFRIECVAKNVMNFSIPDERGNTPMGKPICEGLETTTCLLYPETIADQLCASLAAKTHDVYVSKNAGGYICNYMF